MENVEGQHSEKTAAPWGMWVAELPTEPRTLDPTSDGRVTLAEYLERFDPQLAEFIPSWELTAWMGEVNRLATAAEVAFRMPPTFRAPGTRTFHPHTFAWVIGALVSEMAYQVEELPMSNGWIEGRVASPLVRRTEDERAKCEPRFLWRTCPEHIVEVYGEPQAPY